MQFTVNMIAAMLNGKVEGNGDEIISSVSKIEEGAPGSISFLSNPKYEHYIYDTKATAVIIRKSFVPEASKSITTTLIKVDDPYSAFTTMLEEYERMIKSTKVGVEEPSYVGSGSVLGDQIYRGAFSYIGNGCEIGDYVKIYPQAFIGDKVKIGKGTIVYPGAKILENTVVGENCVIQSGAVLGSEGFGFAPQVDGSYKTIPQLGIVILENNVSVGANTTIDRATMGATMLGNGVKLDNLVQVAHNVVIKANTVVAAQAGISGSAKIGESCMIGGQAGIAGHLEIADKVQVAAKTGIASSVKQPGSTWLGFYGIDHKDYLKAYAVFRKLPELKDRIKQLEEKTLNLPAQ